MATSITSVLSTPASLTSTFNSVNSAFTASFSVSGLIDSNFPTGVLSGSSTVFNATLAYTVTANSSNFITADTLSVLLTLGSIFGTQSFYGFVQPGSTFSQTRTSAAFVLGFTGSDFLNTTIALSSNANAVILNPNVTSYIDIPQTLIPFDNDILNNVSYIHTVGDNVRRWNLFG
jgi:hypothetical protein